MPTLPRVAAEPIVRVLLKPILAARPGIKRPLLKVLSRFNVVPGGVTMARQSRGGVFGDLVAPAGHAAPARILHLHGGAYDAGSPATHAALVGALVAATDEAAFLADYRLAPEHPAPAALDDALAAYEAMTAEADGPLAITGDSAGAGLAIATAVAARDRGLAAPAALALVSPWVDLAMSGTSYRENRRRDAVLGPRGLERAARAYGATLGIEDPICSPIRGELAGLPPTLIHAGANEILLSDAQELARRARAAGVEVQLRVFDDLWHDFHLQAGTLREADEAISEIASFVGGRLRLM